jgi:hypothetical protein
MSTNGKPLPSQERLQELFSYDPKTGELTRKIQTRSYTKVGERVGGIDAKGYRSVSVEGISYREHRVIWMLVTGEDPRTLTVDHINRIRDDNRWANLRLATGTQQQRNHKLQSRNTSGIKGVSWIRSTGKWQVTTREQGRSKNLGSFTTIFEAAACRISYENNHEDRDYFANRELSQAA